MGELGSFTRRTVLRSAAAAGAVTLLPAEVARARAPQGVLATRTLGTLVGTSPPVGAGRPFVLVGVQWSGPRGAALELRALSSAGRWTPWVSAASLGHDPDGPARIGGLFGEPLWTGPAQAVQLRSAGPARGVRLHFVSARSSGPGSSPAAGASAAASPPLALPVLDAGPGQPPIIARRGWAQGQARPGPFAGYGSVKLAFVHHTVNPNGYGPGQVPAMLRAIFDYHRYVRGYFDIAYNFLIDAYGRIWEGRAGGIDMAVVGAQAGGYNAESTGVALLGDFTSAVPSSAALNALQNLLAWKLSLHGVPAHGRVTVVVDPAAAFYTPFAPGAHVSLPRVAGHRDGDLTDCPGNALYDRLPAIRGQVVALAGTPARITAGTASTPVVAGTAASISGSLVLLNGSPLAGAPVELQEVVSGVETTVARLTTGQDGSWNASLTLAQNTLVRGLHRPAPAAVSDWVEVLVAPAITLSVQSEPPLVVSGTVSPAKPHVVIELYNPQRPHKPVQRKRVRTSQGSFTATLRPPAPGSYWVIAKTLADAVNAAGASAAQVLTVG
mgnify:CR=1 FL=1